MKPYIKFNKNSKNLKNSEKFSKELISLPLHPFIKKKYNYKDCKRNK